MKQDRSEQGRIEIRALGTPLFAQSDGEIFGGNASDEHPGRRVGGWRPGLKTSTTAAVLSGWLRRFESVNKLIYENTLVRCSRADSDGRRVDAVKVKTVSIGVALTSIHESRRLFCNQCCLSVKSIRSIFYVCVLCHFMPKIRKIYLLTMMMMCNDLMCT